MNRLKTARNNIINFVKNHKMSAGIILVIFLILLFFLRPKPPKPVETTKVTHQNLVQTVSITGVVAAENAANLTFPFAGKIAYLPFNEGDSVAKGQVIASLDPSDLQANLRQAEQDFTAAKAASEKLYNAQGYPTAESFDQKVARTAVDAAQNKAYDNVVKARKAIADSSLIAPFSGVLVREDVKNVGVNVSAGSTWTIIDPSTLEFKMEIDEADIAKISTGQNVNVNLDAFPDETLKLTVTNIDLVTHTTSSGGNAYFVKANMPVNTKYRIGMNGNADIITGDLHDVLVIPFASVQNDNEVYVKTGNKFKLKKVRLGLENDISAEVLSGLTEGDEIATDPTSVSKTDIKN